MLKGWGGGGGSAALLLTVNSLMYYVLQELRYLNNSICLVSFWDVVCWDLNLSFMMIWPKLVYMSKWLINGSVKGIKLSGVMFVG